MNTMKAVGYINALPINEVNALVDIELPQPAASGHDLLIKVNAIAVNPVDCKIRQNVAAENGEYKVIGWDAVGEVVAAGELVRSTGCGWRVLGCEWWLRRRVV